MSSYLKDTFYNILKTYIQLYLKIEIFNKFSNIIGLCKQSAQNFSQCLNIYNVGFSLLSNILMLNFR